MEVVTLKQRKDREAARRGQAVQDTCVHLRDFARTHGGRFVIYGSAARREMRYNSDLDILIDVPESVRVEAWKLVERLAAENALPVDVDELRFTSPEFRNHIMKHAIIVE